MQAVLSRISSGPDKVMLYINGPTSRLSIMTELKLYLLEFYTTAILKLYALYGPKAITLETS